MKKLPRRRVQESDALCCRRRSNGEEQRGRTNIERMGRGGLEHSPESPKEPLIPNQSGAESGARPPDSGPSPPTDPDLARVVAAWSKLPEPIRRAVLALIHVGA